MRNLRSAAIAPLLPLAFASLSCQSGGAGAPGGGVDPATPAATPAAAEDPELATVSVVGISDFHGWLKPLKPKNYPNYFGGIAYLGALVRGPQGLDPNKTLLLDNGDMFTGPTESTLLKGKPVIEAYNALGMDAANIANHEFDFGLEELNARIAEAKFPFLGANIKMAGTTDSPSWVKPFVIIERGGVKVGVVGLSYLHTPKTTLAKHVASLAFEPYGETLKKVLPEVRAAGAEATVVLFHDTVDEIVKVLEAYPGLGIDAVIAGQNHRKGVRKVGDTVVVNPGGFGRSSVRFDIGVDRQSRQVVRVDHALVDVTGPAEAPPVAPDATLLEITERAEKEAAERSGEVLGQLAQPLPVGSYENSPLGHMILDAWLDALPGADFAMMNHGAIRQPLAKGAVTVGDVLAVLPFENNLYVVELSGQQLFEQLAIDQPVVAGFTWSFGQQDGKRQVASAVDEAGQAIEADKTYRIVILDFMYGGGDGFTFKDVDATPEDTGFSLRQPVINALRRSQSMGQPLSVRPGARAAPAR